MENEGEWTETDGEWRRISVTEFYITICPNRISQDRLQLIQKRSIVWRMGFNHMREGQKRTKMSSQEDQAYYYLTHVLHWCDVPIWAAAIRILWWIFAATFWLSASYRAWRSWTDAGLDMRSGGISAPWLEVSDKEWELLNVCRRSSQFKSTVPHLLHWHLLSSGGVVKSWSREGRNGATVYAGGRKCG